VIHELFSKNRWIAPRAFTASFLGPAGDVLDAHLDVRRCARRYAGREIGLLEALDAAIDPHEVVGHGWFHMKGGGVTAARCAETRRALRNTLSSKHILRGDVGRFAVVLLAQTLDGLAFRQTERRRFCTFHAVPRPPGGSGKVYRLD